VYCPITWRMQNILSKVDLLSWNPHSQSRYIPSTYPVKFNWKMRSNFVRRSEQCSVSVVAKIHVTVLLIKKTTIDCHPSHKQKYNRQPPLLMQFFFIPNWLNNFTDFSTYFSYLITHPLFYHNQQKRTNIFHKQDCVAQNPWWRRTYRKQNLDKPSQCLHFDHPAAKARDSWVLKQADIMTLKKRDSLAWCVSIKTTFITLIIQTV
jgi:1,2-phenylacetyl-CoA epoxidase PaaB subunit